MTATVIKFKPNPLRYGPVGTYQRETGGYEEKCPLCENYHSDAGIPFWLLIRDFLDGLCRQCASEHFSSMLAEADEWNQRFEAQIGPAPDVHPA